MAEEKDKIIEQLEARIKLLSLVLEDKEVRGKFEQLLVKEVELDEYLLGLENEKIEAKEGMTFGDLVSRKLKLSWKDWIKKIFKKLNSLLTSLIPTGGS
jgi:hypothetical protein